MAEAPREWTVLSMLEWATDFFKEKSIPHPRLSIEWLLAEVLQIKRLDLYLKFDRPLSKNELDQLRPLVKRRSQHEPLQYILGFTEFLNARINVNPSVLIPRIETEQMIEIILDDYSDRTEEPVSVLDIGTGSGCIPIALKMEFPKWNIQAFDIDTEALETARQNAEENQADVTFFQLDLFDWQAHNFEQSFDIITSNPPYIPGEEIESLESQVREYEPVDALRCNNPLQYYKPIADLAQKYLQQSGHLYLEIHQDFGEEIRSYFGQNFASANILQDLDTNDRFLIAQKS